MATLTQAEAQALLDQMSTVGVPTRTVNSYGGVQAIRDIAGGPAYVEKRLAEEAANNALRGAYNSGAISAEQIYAMENRINAGQDVTQAVNQTLAQAAAPGGGASQPATSTYDYIDQYLYQPFLGRPGEAAGREFYGQEFGPYVDAAEAAQFIQGAVDSGEITPERGNELLRQVTGYSYLEPLYQEYLGRPGDIGGLTSYAQSFGPEIDLAERRAFIEGAVGAGELSRARADELLAGLTSGTTTGGTTTGGTTTGGTTTQTDATGSLLPGTATADPRRVTQLYYELLGRAPEPEGLAYWSSQPAYNLESQFYRTAVPEIQSQKAEQLAEIPVSTNIPKPLMGTTPPGAANVSVEIPGQTVTTDQGAPKPLTVDISKMAPEQQALTNLIVGRMPRPTTTTSGPVFTPSEVNAQLELERLKAMNAPATPAETPVAGFAQGGMVGNDISQLLRNQQSAIQRESQSRQMLTNMGVPPVKKFSDGGPAGSSSSGVRRLKMSGYQDGGDVSSNRFAQMMEDDQRAQDQFVGDINRQLSELITRYRSGEQGVTEKDLLPFFPGYSEYDIAQMYGMTTEAANPRMSEKINPFTVDMIPGIKGRGEAVQRDYDRMVREKRLLDPMMPKKIMTLSDGGDVSNDAFIQEMMTGTLPTDQGPSFRESSEGISYKQPKSQELANQIRNLFQQLETPSPSSEEEYLKRRPTPESREPIRSRKAMEAFLKAANPRMEIEERPLPGGKLGFVRAGDPNTLVISTRQFPAQREETAFHELEHSLSERGGNPLGRLTREGKPLIMDNNYRFDVLYNQDGKTGGEGRYARYDTIKRMIDNKDKIEKFFGRPIDSNYFSREPEGGLLAEQFADLSALEQVTNKSITRDPEMRKLLFPDDKAAAVYDAITGLRQTRLDAKDRPPYTPDYPEEKGMVDWFKEKLGIGAK